MAKGERVTEEPIPISVGAVNVLEELIAKIEDLVRSARSMPLSSTAMVPRGELIDLIESLKRAMPEEVGRARSLIRDAEAVLQRAREEADKIIDRAKGDRERAIAKTEIVQAASREAEKLVSSAEAHAKRIRAEAEQYVEGKLANFEVALQKTLKAVERGRARIAGRLADAEEITAVDDDDE